MNRKQFLILVIALVVLGGAGLTLFWQDIAAYRTVRCQNRRQAFARIQYG